MKIRDLVAESAAYEVRKLVEQKLLESVSKHLSSIAAALKARKDDNADMMGVDPEQLANIITGLKVIGKKEYRDVITKDDIGINPTNAKELFSLLDKVPDKAQAKLDKSSADIFRALSSLAQSLSKKDQEDIEMLGSDDEAKRRSAVNKLSSFASKVDQMYNQVKNVATKAASADKSTSAVA